MITDEDRKVLSRLLAKCIAFYNCGRTHDAASCRSALDAHLEHCGVPTFGQALAKIGQPKPRNNCGEGA